MQTSSDLFFFSSFSLSLSQSAALGCFVVVVVVCLFVCFCPRLFCFYAFLRLFGGITRFFFYCCCCFCFCFCLAWYNFSIFFLFSVVLSTCTSRHTFFLYEMYLCFFFVCLFVCFACVNGRLMSSLFFFFLTFFFCVCMCVCFFFFNRAKALKSKKWRKREERKKKNAKRDTVRDCIQSRTRGD